MKISNSLAVAAMSACIFAASPASAKKEETPVDPGPPPASFEAFKQLATPALLAGFFDPDAAQITWDRGVTGGYWKPVLSKKIPGWFTCGLVNGKNRMGGYVGARRFVVVYNNGQIVFSEVGDGGNYDFIDTACQQAIAKGILPPAAAGAPAAASVDPTTPMIGIAFTVVPDGAYISNVAPASPAARAGLVQGMVVSHINALPLKGFDTATIQAMLRAADKLTLTIIGKGDVSLVKQPLAQ